MGALIGAAAAASGCNNKHAGEDAAPPAQSAEEQQTQNAAGASNGVPNGDRAIPAPAAGETMPESKIPPKRAAAENINDAAKSRQSPPRKTPFEPLDIPADARGNALLDEVPDSSFLVIASGGEFPLTDRGFIDFFDHISILLQASLTRAESDAKENEPPFFRALGALARGMLKSFSPQKLASLGIADQKIPQFVFYFENNIPVLKIRLSDIEKFRSIAEAYMTQYNVKSQTLSLGFDSAWTLYPCGRGETQAAVNWSERGVLTATFVAHPAQAEVFLRKIKEHPERHKNARAQIAQAEIIGENAGGDAPHAVAALWDLAKFRNAFVAFEAQSDALFGLEKRAGKSCAKEFNRLTKDLRTVLITAEPLSNRKTIAVQSRIRLGIGPQWPFRAFFADRPFGIELPRTDLYPLWQASVSVPFATAVGKILEWSNDIQKNPFKCEFFSPLNALPQIVSEIPNIRRLQADDIARAPYALGTKHFSGKAQKSPMHVSYFFAPHAAAIAQDMGVISSESLKSAQAEQNADNAANNRRAAAPSEAESDSPRVYADARLTADLSALGIASDARLLAQSDFAAAASDADMIDALKETELQPGEWLIRAGWSERLASRGDFVKTDDDPARNYHIDVAAVYDPDLLEAGGADLLWVYGTE